MFYKLIDGKNIVGVITSAEFRKQQKRHNLVLFSDEESAQFVEYNGVYYRDNWLRAIDNANIEIADINIVRIEEGEYNGLKEQLDTGDLPVDNSLEEEVPVVIENNETGEEPITVQKTAAQILEEQIKLAARFAEV